MIFNRLIFASIAIALHSCVLVSPSTAEARPNVILIVTDDQGFGDMACHGNPWLKTPNLDQLAAESVSLTDYHVDPYCTPTRAALMTGRYCTRVGAWSVTQGRQLLNPDETTMAEVFADSGYRTAMFGKWHLGDAWPYAPRFRGFHQVVRHMAGGVNEIGNPVENDYSDDTYFRNGVAERFEGYCTNVWVDEAIKFIRLKSQQPFFIYLPTNAMHSPHIVPEEYSKRFVEQGHAEDRANFFGMIENFDENLGRLLDALADSAQRENTLIIFMGDNGTAQGANGVDPDDGFNAGMRGHKGSVYDGGHRVACLARWPKKWDGGKLVEELTCHRDWLPTLVELCDLKSPDNTSFDGRSMAGLLTGDSTVWPERSLIVERQPSSPKSATEPGSKIPFAVMTPQWRLVNNELYNIKNDPGQTADVASQHPEVVSQLQEDYRQYFADVFQRDDPYTRFHVGAQQQNPMSFNVRDWHPTEGHVIWMPSQLSDDSLFINGYWAINVVQEGRYRVRLSRHPDDALEPMNATRARLKLGNIDVSEVISPTDTSTSFELGMPEGPAILQTWLTDEATGDERGAYFMEVTRL